MCSKVTRAETQHILAYPEQNRQLQNNHQRQSLLMDSLKLQTEADLNSCDVPHQQQKQQQQPILNKAAAEIKKKSKNNSLQSPSSASCSSSFVSSDEEDDDDDDKNSSQPSWLQQGTL